MLFRSIDTDQHGAPLKHGKTGIFFGMKAPLMQDENGQVQESYSVSAGLDFPSGGPQQTGGITSGCTYFGMVVGSSVPPGSGCANAVVTVNDELISMVLMAPQSVVFLINVSPGLLVVYVEILGSY